MMSDCKHEYSIALSGDKHGRRCAKCGNEISYALYASQLERELDQAKTLQGELLCELADACGVPLSKIKNEFLHKKEQPNE